MSGRRGSIRQDTNGTWSFTVDSTAPGEKRRQMRKRGFPTRRAAQTALTKVLRDLDTGAHVDPSRLTLADYICPASRSWQGFGRWKCGGARVG